MSISFNRLCFVALFRHHHFILPLSWNFTVYLEIILMTIILILLALFAAAGSVMFISEATLGVWVMAGAILSGPACLRDGIREREIQAAASCASRGPTAFSGSVGECL